MFRFLSLPQEQVKPKARLRTPSYFFVLRYGVGYHLTIVKHISCDSSRVEQLVKSFVSGAEQVTDVGAELSYILPSSSTPSFPELFDRLEADKVALGIQSFGVSITTMEEVFMKVGEDSDETLDNRYSAQSTTRLAITPLKPSLFTIGCVEVIL